MEKLTSKQQAIGDSSFSFMEEADNDSYVEFLVAK